MTDCEVLVRDLWQPILATLFADQDDTDRHVSLAVCASVAKHMLKTARRMHKQHSSTKTRAMDQLGPSSRLMVGAARVCSPALQQWLWRKTNDFRGIGIGTRHCRPGPYETWVAVLHRAFEEPLNPEMLERMRTNQDHSKAFGRANMCDLATNRRWSAVTWLLQHVRLPTCDDAYYVLRNAITSSDADAVEMGLRIGREWIGMFARADWLPLAISAAITRPTGDPIYLPVLKLLKRHGCLTPRSFAARAMELGHVKEANWIQANGRK